jgi:hydroxypyruvate isomerase
VEYWELSLDRIMMLSKGEFEKLKSKIQETSLPCLACNNFFPKNVRLTGQEYNENTFNQYTTQAVARAAELGAKKIVFGSAAARNVTSDFSMEKAHKQIIERLSFIATVAEKNHVQIEIEHLNRLESNNSFSESVALVKQLNRPNLKSIFDYYHFALGNEKVELITENTAYIGHMHFACTLGRHMPDVNDVMHLKSVLKRIFECKYDETFSIEAYFSGFTIDYAQSVSEIKKILNGISQ